MPVVEVVISPSKASHECSRSVDASRVALRRPEVREQIELFWSRAPPVPSELWHAELLAKAARVAWRSAAPRTQADWMDEEAWQAVRAHAVARRADQQDSRFLSRAWLKTFFAQWRQAVRPDSEQVTPGAALGRCPYGRRRQQETLLGRRSSAGWRVRRIPWRACRRRATRRRRGLRCVS